MHASKQPLVHELTCVVSVVNSFYSPIALSYLILSRCVRVRVARVLGNVVYERDAVGATAAQQPARHRGHEPDQFRNAGTTRLAFPARHGH